MPHDDTRPDTLDDLTPHVCSICGWTYDPKTGDPAKGIPPNTPFSRLRPDWTCYVCSAEKRDFSARPTTPQP